MTPPYPPPRAGEGREGARASALENDEAACALPAAFGHRPPTESDFGYQHRPSRSSFHPMLTDMLPELDRETCDRARFARDPAYDGLFFVGVRTTRIYCRPVCPARPAKSENVVFFPTAAAAERAGFRPCLRCRPETAPGSPAWTGTATTVARGMRLIEEGFLDRSSVEELAGKLGIGPRHAPAAAFSSPRRRNAKRSRRDPAGSSRQAPAQRNRDATVAGRFCGRVQKRAPFQ